MRSPEFEPDQPTFVYDRLYGRVEFTPDDLRLFQTKELSRLREVSLSAIPTLALPTGICATKFEHSVGVGHLARIVRQRPEFREIAQDLYFAALAHDMGTPPFSHASERFQIKLLGKNHEEFVDEVIEDSEFGREIQRQGGSIERVIRLVKGEENPLSDLINGSIDLDNLDNTLRYGLSMGLFREHLYSPENLARAYVVHNDGLALLLPDWKDLEGWEKCRQKAYDFVYSPTNLSPGMMMYRALEFAAREEELPKDYFSMTDNEAFLYLEEKCNERTRTLVNRVRRWIFYPRVFNFATSTPDDSTYSVEELFDNTETRSVLADALSSHLEIPQEDVTVYTGKDRGFKKIHIPIIDKDGNLRKHTPTKELTWMAQVYVHPQWADKSEVIQEFMNDRMKGYLAS